MSTDERLPAEERGGGTDKPERDYVISNRPDDSDAMPGPAMPKMTTKMTRTTRTKKTPKT